MERIYKNTKQFIRFIIVGFLGLLISLLITYILVDFFSLWYFWAFLIATFFTWTFLFFANAVYTFDEHPKDGYVKKYITFMFGYLGIFWINAGIVYILTSIVSIYYLVSIVVATILTTLLTFFYNKQIVFSEEHVSRNNEVD